MEISQETCRTKQAMTLTKFRFGDAFGSTLTVVLGFNFDELQALQVALQSENDNQECSWLLKEALMMFIHESNKLCQ